MGCDIHAYIDIVNRRSDNEEYVSNFAHVSVGRNYWLFGLLADVRVDAIELDGKPLLVEPRGAPENNSWVFEDEYTLFVTDNSDSEGYCTKEQAEAWGNDWYGEGNKRIVGPDWHSASYLYADELEIIQERYSKLLDAEDTKFLGPDEPIPAGYVLEKDYGNGKIARGTERKEVGPHKELAGVIAAMKALNGDDPKRSRFVFFFDN